MSNKNVIKNDNKKSLLFQKVTYMPSKIDRNKNLFGNFKKSHKNYSTKKVKIILPNISNNNIAIMNNNNEKDNFTKIFKNDLKDGNNIRLNKSTIDIRPNLKINTKFNKKSFPSFINIIDNSSTKILNLSPSKLNSSLYSNIYNPNNLLNNQKNKNKNNYKFLKFEKSNISTNKNKDISYFNSIYKDNKDMTNSTFKISRIKLNETLSNKSFYKRLNRSLRSHKTNTMNKSFSRNDSSIIELPRHSRFFKISQKDSVSAKRIYRHYLSKSVGEITKPINNYRQFFEDKSQTFLQKLSRIYCENPIFLSTIKEIKDNKKIAYKKDFNIEEYQATIIELMEQRVSQKHLLDLQDSYRAMNKKLYGVVEPKGRFTILADKLRYNIPSYLLEKFKQLDKEAIISKMNYYNQFKHFKNGNKLVSRFDKINN